MPSHILLVSNTAAVEVAVSEALRDDGNGLYEVVWVLRCADAIAMLAKPHAIAAILVDLGAPRSSGLDAFEQIVRTKLNVPILVLGNESDEQTARETLQRGAQDYLLKERLDGYTLLKALDGAAKRNVVAAALLEEKERAQGTLNSIGDAVISTDAECRVVYLNSIAQTLTGWSGAEALGQPLDEVFRPIDASTREIARNPIAMAISANSNYNLAPNCILIRRDGSEMAVEDSAAPIRDRAGRVTGGVMVFRDVSDARALTKHLAYLAEHDSLTGLSNRARFNDRLGQSLALAKRLHHKVAVLFLDLDGFKPINDSLGHVIGDKLLQSVAQRLSECVRSSDSIGRQGGDEFLILLSELTLANDAQIVAEKIVHALARPHHIEQHQLRITASIGIAMCPNDSVVADDLVSQADFAMYCAKSAGGNRYRCCNPDFADAEQRYHLPVERSSVAAQLR